MMLINRISLLIRGRSRSAIAVQQVLYTFGLRGLGIFVSFLYVPSILGFLGAEKYGIWLALISVLHWFTFMDIGLGLGLKNKLTEALAKKEYVLARELVSTTYFMLIGILFALLSLFHAINPFLSWSRILSVEQGLESEMFHLTSIVFSGFFLTLVVQTISVIYQSLQRAYVGAAALLLGQILALLCIVLLLSSDQRGNIVLVGVIVTFCPIISLMVLTIFSFSSNLSFLRPSYRFFSARYVKEISTLGFKFVLISVSAAVIFSSASFIVIKLFNPSEVVKYNIAQKFFSIPIIGYSIFLTPVWASVTDAYVKRDFAWLRATLKKLNLLSAFFFLGIVCMFLFADSFYLIWVGETVLVPSHLSAFMGLYAIINVVFSPYSHFVNGLGKIQLSSRLSVLWMFIFVLFIIVSYKFFNDSSVVVLALCLVTLSGSLTQYVQVRRLLNESASGVWNK